MIVWVSLIQLLPSRLKKLLMTWLQIGEMDRDIAHILQICQCFCSFAYVKLKSFSAKVIHVSYSDMCSAG